MMRESLCINGGKVQESNLPRTALTAPNLDLKSKQDYSTLLHALQGLINWSFPIFSEGIEEPLLVVWVSWEWRRA